MICYAAQYSQLKSAEGNSGSYSRPSCVTTSAGFFIGDNTVRTCKRCHQEKELTEFHKHPDGKDGRLLRCRACVREWRLKKYGTAKGKMIIRKSRLKRANALKELSLCQQCAMNTVVKNRVLCFSCAEKIKERMHHQRNQLRNDVFSRYGGRKCAICGETKVLCLTIDHIDNNGATHRKVIGGGGYNTYCWLKRNNYPEGFQVLCRNCNWIKHAEMSYPSLSKN